MLLRDLVLQGYLVLLVRKVLLLSVRLPRQVVREGRDSAAVTALSRARC